MIILNAGGGLGNPMFGYAYARALADEFGEEIYNNVAWTRMLDITLSIRSILLREKPSHFSNRLEYLSCSDELKTLSGIMD